MTAKDKRKVKKLIDKLSNFNWYPQNPYKTIGNLKGYEGVVNLLWVFKGQPTIWRQKYFDKDFRIAKELAVEEIDGMTVGDWASLLTLREFAALVKQHMDVFGKFFTADEWQAMLKKKKNDATRLVRSRTGVG